MTTKIIGIKEYRQNITSLWKEAQKRGIRYVVMYHSKPIFEVTPLKNKEFVLENLKQDIKEARQQAMRGEVYSHESILQEFGLK